MCSTEMIKGLIEKKIVMLTHVMNFASVTSGLILWKPTSEFSSCPSDCLVLMLTIMYVCLSAHDSRQQIMIDFWLEFNIDIQEKKGWQA